MCLNCKIDDSDETHLCKLRVIPGTVHTIATKNKVLLYTINITQKQKRKTRFEKNEIVRSQPKQKQTKTTL